MIEPDKNKPLKGEIILTHCRGHDTILTFLFEGFHEQHVRLLTRNYGYRQQWVVAFHVMNLEQK